MSSTHKVIESIETLIPGFFSDEDNKFVGKKFNFYLDVTGNVKNTEAYKILEQYLGFLGETDDPYSKLRDRTDGVRYYHVWLNEKGLEALNEKFDSVKEGK